MKYILVFCILLTMSMTGCDFGVDYSNNPQNVYKSVMKLYSQNYAYLHEAPNTPTELFDMYWPRVRNLEASEAGWLELAQVLQDFMGLLKDEHINVEHGLRDKVTIKYTPKSNIWPTAQSLESKVNIHGDSFAYIYGQIKSEDEIGYILVKELSQNISALDRVNDDQQWLKKIDFIIDDLKSRGVEKMILDIRSFAGGSQTNAEYIIARFVDKKSPYMVSYDLVGPANETSSYEREIVSVSPNSSGARFSGPVVLLMDANTSSGGEIFVLTALQIPGVRSIGVNTGGLPGTITVYDLPNHWTAQFTTSKTYLVKADGSDGETYLTVGIPPQIRVENPDDDPAVDKILERGIQEIKSM